MRGKKILMVLVVAMLFITTIAVGFVSCDGESDNVYSGGFHLEQGSLGGVDPCGGGDHCGPGSPN
jgi:hypothetical protein